jgi:hypothetical protein
MSERESTLTLIARLCTGIAIISLAIAIMAQGCTVRDLQRRVGTLENQRR